jgi:hypothetical protein
MDDFGKSFADLGKVVVDPPMHTGREKREAFEETTHVRIVASIRIEQKPPSNLRILARKLSAHLAQIGKFTLIVFKHFLAHSLLHLVLAAD